MPAHACSGVTRLPQPRLDPKLPPARREHAYDPAIPSDGLTLDTDRGPVDLVAVLRALTGVPTALTVADARYAITLLPATHGTCVEIAAAGLGITPESVGRAVVRLHVRQRTNTPASTATRDRTRA